MNYNYEIRNFCESKIYSKQPEYLNSFTSLYLCFIAYYNFYYNRSKLKNIIIYLYSFIFINGIASFLYHWFGWYFFKLFDEFTMVLPLWLSISEIMYMLNYEIYKIIGLTLFNVLLLIFDVFMWFDFIFPLFFGLEFLTIIYFYNKAIEMYPDKTNDGIKGIIICSSAGLIWIVTEFMCNKFLIFGHSLWHIGIGYGIHNLTNYFNRLKIKHI